MKNIRTNTLMVLVVVFFIGSAAAIWRLFPNGLYTLFFLSASYTQTHKSTPYPSIELRTNGNPILIWKVDDRFRITFDNGFIVDSQSRMENFPTEWTCERNNSTLFISDNTGYYSGRTEFSGEIDSHNRCTEVMIWADGSSELKDLRTGRSVHLHKSSYNELVKFFESLPR